MCTVDLAWISFAVARMMRRRGYSIVHYLKDFLLIGKSKTACTEVQRTLRGTDTPQRVIFKIFKMKRRVAP